MLVRLIEHVAQLPADEIVEVTIQDVAMCGAWYDSYAGIPAEKKRYADLPLTIDDWASKVRKPDRTTEGRRHQYVLRELIDRLEAGEARRMAWDEAALLNWVSDLSIRAADAEMFERVRGLVEPHAGALHDRLEGLEVAPGLPKLSDRLHVVTAQDIRQARPREIKLFAGIDMESRGPVLVHSGHLRVLDNVPENCTLVVEDGSCSVDGFVMGKVAVTENCEVRENISGVVVVRQGNVRTRNIIDKAYVVAKWGSVYCRHSQSPELVFAGTEIFIQERAVTGRYISPRIHVKGDMMGGEYHVANRVVAGRYRHTDARPLSILLRREITCRDYGERPGEEASRLLAEAARLRRQLTELEGWARMAEQEAARSASTALIYLFGGDANRGQIDRVRAVEDRLQLIERLVAGLGALGLAAEERLQAMMSGEDTSTPIPALEELRANLMKILREEEVSKDVAEDAESMLKLCEKMAAATGDKCAMIGVVAYVRERAPERARDLQELTDTIEEHQGELNRALKIQDMAGTIRGPHPKVQLLRKVLTATAKRAATDPLMKRVQSGYMRVALRNVNAGLERSKTCRDSITELRSTLAAVAEPLRKDYHINIAEESGEGATAQASGRFDTGVSIYADVFLLGENNPPRGTVLQLSNESDRERVFIRNTAGLVEEI
ncbi:MAG: DUF342 domain-containing protein [bacterium]|nr:DUF342 domain-containing protein [bacterium]